MLSVISKPFIWSGASTSARVPTLAASEFMSLQRLACGFLAACAVAVLIGNVAHAQNLDQGKSAAKLFADGCATCHHSARGIAKGRFSLTLFLFLQEHYTSNPSSAWTLTSYLESVDSAQRGRSRAASPKPFIRITAPAAPASARARPLARKYTGSSCRRD